VLILSGCLFGSAAAYAESDSGTYVVIPGRPDVPVIVNPYGFDASYTIVEGDFGLNKPAMANASIVVGPHVVPVLGPRRYYFPHSDEMPGYGRYEVQPSPNRALPPPAQSYSRSRPIPLIPPLAATQFATSKLSRAVFPRRLSRKQPRL